ncbi:MAG: hypothetical protein K2Y13_01455 [Burkholderiaceae bacterium]|nr:hypothetical protein [Burkholderiaceae bacterium]
MWDLILRLYHRFFGADCIPSHDAGYLEGDIVREIERFLLDTSVFEPEEGELPDMPLSARAHQRLNRLIDAGWFIREELGVRKFIGMHPVIVRLIDTLDEFAQEGPQFIAGQIQVIHSQLLRVQHDPKSQASGFHAAARECARLIKSLSATTFRVRDLIKAMSETHSTREYIERFFSDYISELYVRDYKLLRTENHPLRYRWEILAIISDLQHDEAKYNALLEGYRDIPTRSGEDRKEMLEVDFSLFSRLHDVDRFLRRLDETNNAATQRALAFLTYKLKASDRIDLVIDDTVKAVNQAEAINLPIWGNIIPQGPVLGNERLRMAPAKPEKPVRQPLKRRQMTLQERAEFVLRKAMASNRDTSVAALRHYVEQHLQIGQSLHSEHLPTNSVQNVVLYLVFAQLALMAKAQRNAIASHPLLRRLGVDVKPHTGRRTITPLWESPSFTITREK